ncbi:uncharacterized protein THITE_2106691, partial [Thermothielavioides terrestris NRRL 8126]
MLISYVQVEWVNKGRMTREFKKFLFRLNRKDYQEALATISKGISDLEGLTRLSVSLEPARRRRTRGRVLNILRDLSTSIYRALRSSILCNDSHDVGLELNAPPIEAGYDDEDEKVRHSVQFTMAISSEVHDGAARRHVWDEISIKPAEPAAESMKQPLDATPVVSCSPATKPKRAKKISFVVAQKLLSVGSVESPAPGVKVAMANLAQHATRVAFIDTSVDDANRTPGPLVDLCVALKNARGDERPACYGHLIDKGQHTERCFRVYPRGSAADSDTWSVVTLRDVLEQRDGLQPLASLKEKIRLAHIVASSVLQLSKTPWLPEAPTSTHVYFFKRGPRLSYEHPFLLRNFPERERGGGPSSSSSQDPSPRAPNTVVSLDRNPTLFALGIMLLEIVLGASLDALREPHERALAVPGDTRGLVRDSVTAHRLLEQRVALISPAYKVVVERCMGCVASRDLDEEDFRREVYGRVVLELEAILGHTSLG